MVIKKKKITLGEFLSSYVSAEWNLLVDNYITIKSYEAGERIFDEGKKVDAIYFINSGKVKVVSSYDYESERILRFSHEGEFLGHRALSAQVYPISAAAMSDAEITSIPKDIFIKLIKTNPDFSVFMIEFLASDLSATEERMKSIIHNEVIVRIGMIICILIDAYGFDQENPKKLGYTLSRSDMASFAGTTYESVIRNLSKLEEMKLIKLEGKSIVVPKEIELRKFVNSSTHRRF